MFTLPRLVNEARSAIPTRLVSIRSAAAASTTGQRSVSGMVVRPQFNPCEVSCGPCNSSNCRRTCYQTCCIGPGGGRCNTTTYTQTCKNFSTDPSNCGACGHVCPPGTSCCSGVCVDTSSDPSNCGACGRACRGGTCTGGVCQCPSGTTNCGGTCANISTDPLNCGSCGRTCPADCSGNRQCSGGVCVAPQTYAIYTQSADGCVSATPASVAAFSVDAALQCALRIPGVTGASTSPPSLWQVRIRCYDGSCTSGSYYGWTFQGAAACMQSTTGAHYPCYSPDSGTC